MSRSKIALSALCISLVSILTIAAPAGAKPQLPVEFTHGVASGDVTKRHAILWTRVDRRTVLQVKVFDNPEMEGKPVFQRSVQAKRRNDFTARVRANRLSPATTYYYRFDGHGDTESDVGTFTTTPKNRASVDVKFAYSGDSDGTNVEGVPYHGNFEVLDAVRLENPDFFVYLGDTIYSDSSLRPAPAETLDEYRDAYKVNRDIEALPNLLKSTSIYAQWDDHEVMNDYDGQTVDPDRYANGREAFLEYMPMKRPTAINDPDCAGKPLTRKFHRGKDVDIFIPDERSCRSASVEIECQGDLAPTLPTDFRLLFELPPEPPAGCLEAMFDPSRTMLGQVQKQQFKHELLASNAKFKFVMSQLAIQQYYALPYDRWEGYGAERAEILNFIRDNQIENVIFLTTDNHANIVNEVFIDRFTDPEPIADEMITGPIATFTLKEEIIETFGKELFQAFQGILTLVGVDCRNLNTDSYGVVDVDSSAGTAAIELKDATGAVVHDDLEPSIPCTKSFG